MSYVKPKAFWPVVIGTTNCVIPYKVSGVDHTVSVALATYFSAATLAAAIQTAIRAGGLLPNIVITVDATGHFVFQGSGLDGAFILRWSLTTNSIYLVIGFTAVDTALGGVATPFTSPNQHQNGWYSPVATAADSLSIRDRASDVVSLTMAGQTKFVTENELARRNLDFKWLPPEYTYIAFEAGASVLNTAIERLWQDGRSRFRYWPDGLTEGTSFDYVLDYDTVKQFLPVRMYIRKGLYEVKLGILGYVA